MKVARNPLLLLHSAVKREGKNDKKGLNTYSAGLETMSQFLTFDEWNEQTIEERATFLYENAKEIWKI